MMRVVQVESYGVAVGPRGQCQPWKEITGHGAVTLRRNTYSGLHLIAYGIRPASLGRYAIALDILTDLMGGCRPRTALVEAFMEEVLPVLLDAGEAGLPGSALRTWLAIHGLVMDATAERM